MGVKTDQRDWVRFLGGKSFSPTWPKGWCENVLGGFQVNGASSISAVAWWKWGQILLEHEGRSCGECKCRDQTEQSQHPARRCGSLGANSSLPGPEQ